MDIFGDSCSRPDCAWRNCNQKKYTFLYFPMMEGNPLNWETLLIYVIYGGMCMLPMVINIVEDIKWHYLKSEI